MKNIAETDIYLFTLGPYKTNEKIKNVLTGNSCKPVLTELSDIIASMQCTYHDLQTTTACNALDSGRIVLVYGDPAKTLPAFMPFIKVKDASGVVKVYCDLSYTTFEVKKNRVTGETMYSMDIRQLNSILLAALCYLQMEKNTLVPPKATEVLASNWGKMFCKVLNRTIYLNTYPERYEAFYYFGMMYFMVNILEMNQKLAEDFAIKYLKNGKSVTIKEIEGNMISQNADPYKNFESFCTTMFNHSITGIATIKGKDAPINMVSYLRAFVSTYDQKSLFALATLPYFLYVYISVNNANRGFNRRVFEDIMVNPKQYAKLMSDLSPIIDIKF